MDWVLYLVIGIIAVTLLTVLIILPAVHFSKKQPAQLDDIHKGMSEAEMLEKLGKPKKTEQVDAGMKLFLYHQVDKGGFLLWSYYKDFVILTKDGVVIHIAYL